VKTQLTPMSSAILINSAPWSAALRLSLPKVPPNLEAKGEGAFRKLCEALSMAEGK
jgi:hypothetical protein